MAKWEKWSGKGGQPVKDHATIDVKLRAGDEITCRADEVEWEWARPGPSLFDVIKWRVSENDESDL